MKYFVFIALILVVLGVIGLKGIKFKKSQEDDNVIYMDEKPFKLNFNLKFLWVILGVIILVIILGSSFYTVDQTEFAVLTTFGKPSNIIGSGLKFKLPYPIQKVHKLSKETFSLTIGYQELGDEVRVNEYESKMITGDENIILADLEVQWKIVDPIAYLYSTSNPKTILYNATSSSLRDVIGSSTVDEALTDGRTKIINDIRQDLIQLVEEYDLGINIINVNLQDVDLPTQEVDAAFKSVTDAREERATKINEAEKYRNEKINQVEGERAAILSKAESEKTSIIEKAKGDVAQFNAIYSEYKNNPEITRHRLTIQALELAFKDAKLIIVDDNSQTVKYLPIDSLVKKGGN